MVIQDHDRPVDEILASMKKLSDALFVLQDSLVMRAKLQSYTEKQFNDLVQVTKEGIEFLNLVRAGDVIEFDWIEARDMLVERAQRLIADT